MTLDEWRDLARAARQLQGCAETLTRSSWQGAPAILVNLAQVHEVIAAMYNRAEPAALQRSQGESPESPQDASGEGGSSESSSEAPIEAPGKKEA